MFCTKCGKVIPDDSLFCTGCGSPVKPMAPATPAQPVAPAQPAPATQTFTPVQPAPVFVPVKTEVERSSKSPSGAFVLCWFFGVFGAHDLYVGKKGLGFTKLSLTLGFLILSIVFAAAGSFAVSGLMTILVTVALGVFGVWAYVDMFRIGCGGYADGKKLRLRKCTWGLVISIIMPVLLVVLGIVAAVAVPKLFGQIAKSKGAEVATNMAAYMNAQDAYFVGADRMGSAEQIGYDVPVSQNFDYSVYSDGVIATSKVNLDDCPRGSQWVLSGKSNGYSIQWSARVISNGGSDWACEALTPGFKRLVH